MALILNGNGTITGPNIDIDSSGINIVGDVALGNNNSAIFGIDSDAKIYYDGFSHYFDNFSAFPDTQFRVGAGGYITMKSGTNRMVQLNGDTTGVTLYHTNSPKIATLSTGVSVTGNVTASGSVSAATFTSGGSNIIQWVEVTPAATEWSFTSTVISTQITLNPSSVPSNARYVLADVFATANGSDHQNFVFARSAISTGKNWVDTRGNQPSLEFNANIINQRVTLTYNGEVDGYSPNYGVWYSSLTIPTTGRNIYFGNYGNSGTNGWLYVIVKAYSL